MAKAATENVRPNRMSRQRQKTRASLLNAALSVMARKGVDATTINDITETADVGFGSFYNHFGSKEELIGVVTHELLDRIAKYIDSFIVDIKNPWEAIATAFRLFTGILISKPEWAQFMMRRSATPGYKNAEIFQSLYRDIGKVAQTDSARIADPGTVKYAVAGAMLLMVIALLDGDLPAVNAPNRIAAAALRILGQTEEEIAKLLSGPPPKIGKISLDD